MNAITRNPRIARAVLISTILTLPFLALELKNQRLSDFSLPLFAALWALPLAFVLLAGRVLHIQRRLLTVAAGVLMLGIGWFWVMLVIDQMPCFLGVPNCD